VRDEVYVVCEEHLEEAIDAFLETYGVAPDILYLAATSFTDWTAPEHCHYCTGKSLYLVV